MTNLERFLAAMEYQPADRLPSWEVGVWGQTRERWRAEGLDVDRIHWSWFNGETALGMDVREFIQFNRGMMPAFTAEVLQEDERTQLIRDSQGRVRRALKEGTVGGMRMSMDTYLDFPVKTMADWQAMKHRYDPTNPQRYEQNWRECRVAGWQVRRHPLIFGPNTSTSGFYWTAREWLGTEGLCFAWYDQPDLMHDMMEFQANFLIETARPVLAETTVEYICLAEDLAMKTGPLLSPATYRTFIFPHLKRVVEFYKTHGVRYVIVDTDGNPEAVVPLMMDAGVDCVWPCERAADQDPVRLRQKFGKSLRLWGGVDKRELTKDRAAIDVHLATLRPLVEAGGYIPTIDHTVPPDISWDNFRYYLDAKQRLIAP